MSVREERKRAAILAADMVSYSRLVALDEARTIARLRSAHDRVVVPTTAKHGGRVFKTTGDGFLAEFPDSASAVACGVAIQEALAALSSDDPPERKIEYRIGINAGDVLLVGDDVYGDVVNVAARLEGLASPSGICIADAVRESSASPDGIGWVDGGSCELKNIDRRIRVWHWSSVGARLGAKNRFGRWRPTIAVLPFANLSDDAEQAYFADGLTEDLISALTLWRCFPVVSRHSSFTYQGRQVSVPEAARELGATYVVEGSVRKAGKRVRVSSQLIDGASGHQIWAERFDRDLDEIFELQDELILRIASILAPEVARAEFRRAAHKRPSDLDAWDLVLRGDAALAHTTVAGFTEARDLFERAAALDPSYSEAQTGLAISHYRPVQINAAEDKAAALAAAVRISKHAIDLDPASARAHFALSTAYILGDEHELALAEAHRAHNLNPNDPTLLHALGNKSDLAGDPEGVARMKLAQQLNPRDPRLSVQQCYLARALVNAGAYDEASATARDAIAGHPTYGPAHFILAIALAHRGDAAAAGVALTKAVEVTPGILATRANWRPYADHARNRHLTEGLRKAKEAARLS